MRFALKAPGFEVKTIEIETAGFFTGVRLLQNGEPAPKGARRGTFALRRDDGGESTAKLRPSPFFVDPVPAVEIDGRRYEVVPPFRWYELVWLGLPLLLIFVGGAIGALVGVLAAGANATVFRSDRPALNRYALTAGISVFSVILYVAVASIFLGIVGR